MINSLPWDCVLRVFDILLYERDAQVSLYCCFTAALLLLYCVLRVFDILLYERDAQVLLRAAVAVLSS